METLTIVKLEEEFFGEGVMVTEEKDVLAAKFDTSLAKALLERLGDTKLQPSERIRQFMASPLTAPIPLPKIKTGKYYPFRAQHPNIGMSMSPSISISVDPWCTPSRRPLTGNCTGSSIDYRMRVNGGSLRKGMAQLRRVERNVGS